MCLGVGVLIGACTAPLYTHFPDFIGALTQNEIVGRGKWQALASGFFVAAPSGVGVALAVTGGGINALVGVAISAALLPPVVNAGLCTTIGLYKIIVHSSTVSSVRVCVIEISPKMIFQANVTELYTYFVVIIIHPYYRTLFRIRREGH